VARSLSRDRISIVDAAPAVLIEKGTKDAVEKAKAALEAAGATVSVK
jgi:large subunit ribosomal protein L7/L12